MKKLLLILGIFLLAGIMSCQKEDYDMVLKSERPVESTVKMLANTRDGAVKGMVNRTLDPLAKNIELTTIIFNKDQIEGNLKSAGVAQTDYFQRIDVFSGSNSFLQFFCRNANKVGGRSVPFQMNQFLIDLPDFITDEHIKEIKYARKDYNGEDPAKFVIEDADDDWKMINEKIKKKVIIDNYTVSNAIRIEQSIQHDDWLIVKVQLNKSVKISPDAYYYVKTANEWSPVKTYGFGEKNYDENGQW